MVNQRSAIRPAPLELALVLFLVVSPILLFSASQMPRIATLGTRAPISKSVVAAAYGKLPLSFEINQGQTDPRVKFLSRGSGYSLFLTSDEAVLSLRQGSPVSKNKASLETVSFKSQSRLAKATPVTESVVRMRLIGANPNAKVSGLEELPGKSNYFIGNDPRKWRPNVPNYVKVKYANVYPGIDLVYYGNQRQLEYDFVVQPGADPRRIKLAVQSLPVKSNRHSALRVDHNGDLIASITSGEVRFHRPIVYQPSYARPADDRKQWTGNRRLVGGRYLLKGSRVTFEVANYDKTRPLVIDPTLAYSTFLGSYEDEGRSITVDALGDAYVTGETTSPNFPTTPGAFQTSLAGSYNAFVTKLTPIMGFYAGSERRGKTGAGVMGLNGVELIGG